MPIAIPPLVIVTHKGCLNHRPPAGNPENAERLRVVLHTLGMAEFDSLLRVPAPLATRRQLTRFHSPDYVDAIISMCPGRGEVVPASTDTAISAGSAEAALRAAGGAIAGVDTVMRAHAASAFVIVRPPGHHAEAAHAMGFCIFNNPAAAAWHARAHWSLDRIAVVDFDAHHGNGTQAALEHHACFFYASTHQYPAFPGTGHEWERGIANNVVNVPLIPNSAGEDFRRSWRDKIFPSLNRFAPQLLIISAGFDAHRADPLSYLQLEASDFEWITVELIRIAEKHSAGRIVSVLEGGYNLRALAASVAAHVRCLMRERSKPAQRSHLRRMQQQRKDG